MVAATVGAARWPRLLAFTHQQYGGLGAEMWERAAAKAEAERQRAALEARAQVAEAQRQVAMLQVGSEGEGMRAQGKGWCVMGQWQGRLVRSLRGRDGEGGWSGVRNGQPGRGR